MRREALLMADEPSSPKPTASPSPAPSPGENAPPAGATRNETPTYHDPPTNSVPAPRGDTGLEPQPGAPPRERPKPGEPQP